MFSPLIFYVALSAQFRYCRNREHVLIFSSVSPVATQTRQGQVFVSFINNLFADWMGRMPLIVVTKPAELNDRLLGGQQRIVGGVGRMANSAHPVLDRLMLCYRLLLALDRVLMARAAKLDRRSLQESPLRRRVGAMAVQTSILSHDRPMEPVFGEHLVDHIVVAAPAQFKTFFLKGKRFWRRRAFMTEIACFVHKGRMGRLVDKSRPVRAVDVMAEGAFAVSHGIVRMLLDEEGFIGLVAALAQLWNVAFQEKSGLGGCMRIVAVDASFLHRIMFESDLLYCVKLVFVAAVTQIVAVLEQIELVVRRVGIMTLNAFAFESNLVSAARVIRQNPFMACDADLVYTRGQLFWKVRCVGTVTSYTPRFIDGCMDKGLFQ